MIKSLTTLTRLLIVEDIQEDDGGSTLRFQQGIQGRLPRGDNYEAHLRLARRSQERHHPIGVHFGEAENIVELIRADNDVPVELGAEDAAGTRVLFQGHDGMFHLSAEHPDSARHRASLNEAIHRKAQIWFIAHKPDLALLDIWPAGWAATISPVCDGNGSPDPQISRNRN